jgi:hypothetical protein
MQLPLENCVKKVYFSPEEGKLPILINSGGSYFITSNINDFLGPICPCADDEVWDGVEEAKRQLHDHGGADH